MQTKILFRAIIAIWTIFLIQSCETDSISDSSKTDPILQIDHEEFIPSFDVNVINGMLSFESKLAFDVTKLEIATANRKAVNNWEKRLGIKTPANIFYEVMLAEDSISSYYENLPESEQEYWRNQEPMHSDIYYASLSSKNLTLVPDGEGGKYFDLNLFDRTAAGVINSEGFVMVEGQIFQYTSNAFKMITDGDINKIEVIKSINNNYVKDNIVVEVYSGDRLKSTLYDWSNDWTQTMLDIPTINKEWYEFDKNWRGKYQKRVKVWIDGHSEPYGDFDDYCAQYINCTFILRAEAQKRNFWGNWVYGDYIPNLTFNASWTYSYKDYSNDPYITYGCGVYQTTKTSVPAYSCTANPSYMCPTSPYSVISEPANNAYFNLTPHGGWSSYPKFFSDVFTVHGTITWSYGPLSNIVYTW